MKSGSRRIEICCAKVCFLVTCFAANTAEPKDLYFVTSQHIFESETVFEEYVEGAISSYRSSSTGELLLQDNGITEPCVKKVDEKFVAFLKGMATVKQASIPAELDTIVGRVYHGNEVVLDLYVSGHVVDANSIVWGIGLAGAEDWEEFWERVRSNICMVSGKK